MPVDGSRVGAWIRPRLGSEFGAVTAHVPRGFGAYARILHPASDSELNSVRWSQVAERHGKTAHRVMQWHAIVDASDPIADPSLGEMDPDELDALCKVLREHTADPGLCFFGLCEIWAWVSELRSIEKQMPRLELPLERNYIVLQGPLAGVSQIGDGVSRYSPSLLWPSDHSWFVLSEVDFDSTLVGGSSKLIKMLVESSEIEVWQMEPTDSLAADADRVNR